MTARTRPAGLLAKVSLALVLLLLPAATAGVAHAAASSSPAAAATDEPLVNWTWLAIGMGGVVLLIVIMFLLTRVFRSRQEED